MGSSSPRGTLLVVGALAVLVAAGVLVWKLREHDAPTTTTSPKTAAASAPLPRSQQTAPPTPVATAGSQASDNDLVDEEGHPRPQPVKVEGPTPPENTKTSAPAPPQKPFTREETITKREADLKMLDDQKARLEADLAAAKTANNASAAHDLEIRIARIADLKKKRTAELDQIRAGGAVPQ
jgi:hypothetical protein